MSGIVSILGSSTIKVVVTWHLTACTVKTENVVTESILLHLMLYTRCYCELLTNVVYNNFQDILVPGNYTVLEGIQYIP